jgi:two-component system nitrogen regulation response regulator GlnG
MTLKVWVVDDDDSIRWVLEKALGAADMDVACFPGGIEMLDALESDTPHVVLTDIRMRGMDGLDLLQRLHAKRPGLPAIVMTAHSDLDSAVAAYQGGAFEYLPKPFDLDDAVDLVRRAARLADETRPEQAADGKAEAVLIGEAPAMQEVFRAIGRLSHSNINVLITGESGTGKELVARALHEHSPRASKTFIAINTAAIPKDLMESEFFGHERGSFTGATGQRQGRFEQADGGTLFLDEIGEMPADLQTRLLRVLADGEFYRVGGHVPVKVDVRVVAATNQDLEIAVRNGRFREDLFHRLNVIRVRLPPLRERAEDIPQLLRHFMARCAKELGTDAKQLRLDVIEHLSHLDWPGNVRQLENVCRWLIVMAPGAEVHLDDLPTDLPQPPRADESAAAVSLSDSSSRLSAADWRTGLARWADDQLNAGVVGVLDRAMPDIERLMIQVALKHSGGHKQDAARLLGWGRNTLTRKLKELDLER